MPLKAINSAPVLSELEEKRIQDIRIHSLTPSGNILFTDGAYSDADVLKRLDERTSELRGSPIIAQGFVNPFWYKPVIRCDGNMTVLIMNPSDEELNCSLFSVPSININGKRTVRIGVYSGTLRWCDVRDAIHVKQLVVHSNNQEQLKQSIILFRDYGDSKEGEAMSGQQVITPPPIPILFGAKSVVMKVDIILTSGGFLYKVLPQTSATITVKF